MPMPRPSLAVESLPLRHLHAGMGTVVTLSLMAGCAFGGRHREAVRPPVLPAGFADSVRTERVDGGALLHTIVNVRAPWRAYVVEQDLRCASVRAVKGSPTTVGRTTTSALLAALPDDQRAYAAVNADFFLFTPPGVPTNLHVEHDVLLSGPGPKPVFTFDGRRAFAIDTIVARGALLRGRDTLVALTAWNRPAPRQNGIVDARWGVALDTVVRTRALRLVPAVSGAGLQVHAQSNRGGVGRYVVLAAGPGDPLATGDTLLLHLDARTYRANRVRPGDTVQLSLSLLTARNTSAVVREAVGGRPIVLRDSVITADVDTEGNDGFRNLNPRTAVGVDQAGRRAWYAVIDGRQPGYSMGMTLRQVGELLQALGAAHGLNLDGGGSSALAIRSLANRQVRVVNRPSDKVERPVGNALALLARCERP